MPKGGAYTPWHVPSTHSLSFSLLLFPPLGLETQLRMSTPLPLMGKPAQKRRHTYTHAGPVSLGRKAICQLPIAGGGACAFVGRLVSISVWFERCVRIGRLIAGKEEEKEREGGERGVKHTQRTAVAVHGRGFQLGVPMQIPLLCIRAYLSLSLSYEYNKAAYINIQRASTQGS